MRNILLLVIALMTSLVSSALPVTLTSADGSYAICEFNQGKLDGMYYSYYANGKLKSKGRFIQNNRAGDWVFFETSGQVRSYRCYDDNFSFAIINGQTTSAVNLGYNKQFLYNPINSNTVLTQRSYASNLLPADNVELFNDVQVVQVLLDIISQNNIATYEDNSLHAVLQNTGIHSEDVVGLRLLENKILLPQGEVNRVKALAFLSDDGSGGYKEMAWVNYSDIMPMLAAMPWNPTSALTKYCRNVLDVFEYRYLNLQMTQATLDASSSFYTYSFSNDPYVNQLSLIEMIEVENNYLSNGTIAQ